MLKSGGGLTAANVVAVLQASGFVTSVQGTGNQILIDSGTPGLAILSTPQNLNVGASTEFVALLHPNAPTVAAGAALGIGASITVQPAATNGAAYFQFSALTAGVPASGVIATATFATALPGTALLGIALITGPTGVVVAGTVSRTSSTVVTISTAAVLTTALTYSVTVMLFPAP